MWPISSSLVSHAPRHDGAPVSASQPDMSSTDYENIWRDIGHNLIQSSVAVVVETFVIAIYTGLVIKTGRLLLRRSRRSKVSLWTSLAVLTMYCFALSLWMIDIHNIITEMSIMLHLSSANTLSELYSVATSKILRLSSIEDVLYAYMTIIGDGIIIWRVYAFWPSVRERLVLVIPLAFLGGSIACSLMLTYCSAHLGADIKLGTYQHPAFCRNIQTTSYSMTLATTAVATILIALKTWRYRRMHVLAFGKTSPQTRTQRVMFLLVESGVLYMLFFLVQVILSLDSVNNSVNQNERLIFAFTIYEYITSSIVGIYPTLVVVLVHSKNSILVQSSEPGALSSALVFKSPTTHATGAPMTTYASIPVAESPRTSPASFQLYEMKPVVGGADTESDIRDSALNAYV